MQVLRRFFIFSGLFFALAGQGAELCGQVFQSASLNMPASVLRNNFVTSRDLLDYRHELHRDFTSSLARLGPEHHWVDLGAGKANAQIQYLKEFRSPHQAAYSTAVAYKLDRWFRPSNFDGRLTIREGAFELQATSSWKKADLITDSFGVISYSKDLHTTFQKVFDLLQVKGELYISLTPWATRFSKDGQHLTFEQFLSTIDGLRVEGQFGTLKITKEKEIIKIPQLQLESFKEDLPPSRRFLVLE